MGDCYAMRKTVISLAAALAVLTGGLTPVSQAAPASPAALIQANEDSANTSNPDGQSGLFDSSSSQGNTDDTTTGSVGSSSEDEEKEGLSKGAIAGILIGSIAAIAAVIGGGLWAIQAGMVPNPLPGIIPGPAPAPKPAPKPAAKPAAKQAPKQAAKPKPAPQRAAPKPAPKRTAPKPAPRPAQSRYYQNCRAVWNDLGRPIRRGEPGYASHLDRDNDGVGCERRPR